MALRISVAVNVSAPDGTPLAEAGRVDLTFNPAPEDMDAERQIAEAGLRRIAEDTVEQALERLSDFLATAGRRDGG